MKTYTAKPLEVERTWWVLDAEGQTLGRLATIAADLLRGKRKPEYTPHTDTGDFVVIVNAEKIQVTGKKETDKRYYNYSGYPGGLKSIALRDLRKRHPERLLEKAIRGMIPHNTLGDEQITKLKVYAGPAHPHSAQKPVPYKAVEVVR